MTKYNVTKSFFDKNTGVGYNVGNTFESEDLERVSFLGEQGFIHVPDATVENVNSNDEPTIKDLKSKAKELGLDGYSKLSRDELIAIIESAEKVGDDNAGEN